MNKIKKIAHIADIHIRPYKRHDEYIKIFDKLYESLKNENPDIIILAGDIVHSKIDMSPELIDITSNLFKNLCNITKTIVIPGNHDMTLNNSNRLDALTPIINNINNDNLIYIKKSCLYKIENINLVHFSVIDDIDIYDNLKKETEKIENKIALYHGIIDQCKNDIGISLSSNIKSTFFDGFDIVMLGDIHARQFMNLDNTIAYPGSLIQQNFGESIEKGYLIWDFDNKKSKFINISNDYMFHTLEIKDNKIPDVKFLSENCRLRLKIFDANNEDSNNIISQIRKKYKPSEIILNRINTSNEISSNNINNINLFDISYQNHLLKNYIKNNFNANDDILQNIMTLNTDLNTKIEAGEFIRNIRWTPTEFSWSNMFSYGETNYINFQKMRGIYGIFAPNAHGKSSFIDSLTYCLFDKTIRESKASNVMNIRYNNFGCGLKFNLNNNEYKIIRTASSNKNKKIDYKIDFNYTDKNGIEHDLNGDDRRFTNKNIRNIIGNFDDFILSTYSAQDKNNGFIESGNSERKDLIIEFIGLGIFDLLHDKAIKIFNETSTELKILQQKDNVALIDEENLNLNQENEKCKSYNKEKEILDEKNKKYKSDIEELNKKILKIDTTLDLNALLKESEKLNNNLEYSNDLLKNKNKEKITIESELKDIQIKINQYELEDINNQKQQLEKLNETKLTKQNELLLLKKDIDNQEEKMKKLDKLEYDTNCKYCMNNIFVKDAIQTKEKLANNLEKYAKDKNYLEKLVNFLLTKSDINIKYSDYNSLKNTLIKKQNDFIKIDSKISELNLEINNINIKINNNILSIEKYKENETNIKINNDLNKKIENINTNILSLEQNIKKIVLDINRCNSQISVHKFKIKSYTEEIEKINTVLKKYDIYKIYTDSIKRNGIPYDIITNIIPKIEQEVNTILNQICNFSVLIELDESKNINIFISYSEQNKWPIELASGMEKFISSIAFRVALTNISSIPRPNFLIIDEGWGKLDSDNLNSVNLLFDYLRTQFDFVIIISHISEMKNMVDVSIDIKKDLNGNSNIFFNV